MTAEKTTEPLEFDFALITPDDIDPLEFMRKVMISEDVDIRDRLSAAKELASYKHKKKRPTDDLDTNDLPTITIEMPTVSSGQESKTRSICLKRT